MVLLASWDSLSEAIPESTLSFLHGKETDTQLPRASQNPDSITQPPGQAASYD